MRQVCWVNIILFQDLFYVITFKDGVKRLDVGESQFMARFYMLHEVLPCLLLHHDTNLLLKLICPMGGKILSPTKPHFVVNGIQIFKTSVHI